MTLKCHWATTEAAPAAAVPAPDLIVEEQQQCPCGDRLKHHIIEPICVLHKKIWGRSDSCSFTGLRFFQEHSNALDERINLMRGAIMDIQTRWCFCVNGDSVPTGSTTQSMSVTVQEKDHGDTDSTACECQAALSNAWENEIPNTGANII